MPERLPSVTATLYLIYNEGYLGTASDALLREELSGEAIRLTSLLAAMLPEESEVVGLLALMLLNDARRDARVGDDGLVLLADQDRARWDREQIERGLVLARRAAAGGPAGPYTVQAAIAAEHARAASAAATDWARIARLYLWLAEFSPSPVVELNRAVAVAEAEGPEAGLAIVDAITGIDAYQPLHAARADLLRRIGDAAAADAAYERAIELSSNPVQRSFLERRRAELARVDAGRRTVGRGRVLAGAVADSSLAPSALLPSGVSGVPLGAEQVELVAVRVAGLRIALVEVERVAVVGHLLGAVVAREGPDQRLVGSASRLDVAGGRHRRPVRGALAAARGLAVLVLLEQVDGVAVGVGQDLAEVGVVGDVDRDRAPALAAGGGRGRGGRREVAAVVLESLESLLPHPAATSAMTVMRAAPTIAVCLARI